MKLTLLAVLLALLTTSLADSTLNATCKRSCSGPSPCLILSGNGFDPNREYSHQLVSSCSQVGLDIPQNLHFQCDS